MSLERIWELAAEHAAWLVTGSLLSLVIGVVLGPVLILRLPAEYFTYRHRHAVTAQRRHPALHLVLTTTKNLIGAVFVVAGLALLVLPGQGLITLLAGAVIMNYPGKFEFERWLVRRPRVLPALNWLRKKYGRAPLLPPDGDPGSPRRSDE
jgi:hypothetical protein